MLENEREVVRVLKAIDKPIMLPTAQWLFGDILGIVDNQVRTLLVSMDERNMIRLVKGWVELS